MQVPGPALDDVMRGLSSTANVDGVLVTMPHKRTGFGHCATGSERATLLGVVSVMRRNSDGTWHGDMLDGLAFVKAHRTTELSPWDRVCSSSAPAVRAAQSRLHCWTKAWRS
jgi:shikimate 5-dehydrogenase